jgi:hypothetical protein
MCTICLNSDKPHILHKVRVRVEDMEAHILLIRRGSHIFYIIGS